MAFIRKLQPTDVMNEIYLFGKTFKITRTVLLAPFLADKFLTHKQLKDPNKVRKKSLSYLNYFLF